MDFDFNISDEVPLWKTFDHLIETESTKTVIDFLSLYQEKEIWDIFNNSVSLPSLLCFDKLIGLDYPSIEKLVKISGRLCFGYYEPYKICNQFLSSLIENQHINSIVKKDLIKDFHFIYSSYYRNSNITLRTFENVIESYIVNGNISEFLNRLNGKTLNELKSCLNKSVYYFRIMQRSVLENVNDDILNYLIFDSMQTNMNIISKNVLFSNISSSAKLLYLLRLTNIPIDRAIPDSHLRYHDMDSAEEVLMNLDLESNINIQLLFLEFVESENGRRIIKQIYDLDKDFLERNFPIGDLPLHKGFIEVKA